MYHWSKALRALAISGVSLAVFMASGISHSQDGINKRGEKAVFEFGVTMPLTGANADYGVAYQNGIRMAVEDINRNGGVKLKNGNTVQLNALYCDDKFLPQDAVTCARQFVNRDNVKAVMTSSSVAAFPMLAFNQQSGFIVMATSQTPSFTTQGNKLVLRYVNNTDNTMEPWVALLNKYIAESGRKIDSAAIMITNSELGQSFAANFAKYWKNSGKRITGTAPYDANGTDFTPQLTKLMQSKPDAIVLITPCGPSATVIKQARGLGYAGTFINSLGCDGSGLVKDLPPNQINGTLLETTAWAFDTPVLNEFKARYVKQFDKQPQFISSVSYVGVQILAAALARATTINEAGAIQAAFADGLGSLGPSQNLLNFSNITNTGDITLKMRVGAIIGGKVRGVL